MKTQNYTTHLTTLSAYSAQNLAITYLSSLIPLSLNVTEENFEDVAEGVYDLCHHKGLELRGNEEENVGGGREDIRVSLAIAMDLAIEVDYYTLSARKFKNGTAKHLRSSFLANDVDMLIYHMCGYERHAATATVDHRQADGLVEDLEEFYEIELDETEEEPEEEPEIDMVEVLIMSPNTVQRVKLGGNQHKPRRKPAARCTKQLVMDL